TTEKTFFTMSMLTPLVFVPVLACFLPLMSATVVQDFNHIERCKDSLYMGTPPRGFTDTKLKRICQRYADRPRYVTLYDPQKRIPVYSAYTFKKTEGDRRVDYPWMYEPQLAEVDGNGNMQPFPTGYLHMKFEDSQAVLDDYSDVVLYERGHLNPDQHQSTPHDRAATYTLTNVVPEIRADPGPPQQLLPRHGLHRDRSDHQGQHDPSKQPGPRGHPRRRVVRLLLH
uniref:DNA/RNA non-specific endonuclease/pyrophosphatase/phosphodiesterase domain-containing protein n=1 Tax=Sander lucioperca TaxID=283035 RepID=A0A8C9XQR3_SANLU